MGWAGPLAGFYLACLGADVIKVEGPRRFDWWRGSRPPAMDEAGLALHERSPVFNSTNRGKRDIALDLTTAEGREIALSLFEGCDVAIENFGVGVLEAFGLTWPVLAARNPRAVLLRQPGFGVGGPESSYRTFGNTIEGMSGLTALMGYEGGPPQMMSNAFGDPVSGLTGTFAILAGLAARARTGRGECIEAAQIEGFLPLVAESFIEAQLTGRQPPRRGNRRQGHEPSGLFPCDGDDAWIAIDVADDAHWRSLARVVGPIDWTQDPSFATVAGREHGRESLRAALSAWTLRFDKASLAETLLEAGIPAAPVNNEADLLGFGPVVDRGFFVPCERPYVGTHLYPALAVRIEGDRALPEGPAPLLGEHTREILIALGHTPEAIARLEASGAVLQAPPPPGV
jgi:crotonobetainyl-CoA:carnitine CoA-transferase CaiB-like acyl-CoA transferase